MYFGQKELHFDQWLNISLVEIVHTGLYKWRQSEIVGHV